MPLLRAGDALGMPLLRGGDAHTMPHLRAGDAFRMPILMSKIRKDIVHHEIVFLTIYEKFSVMTRSF